MSQPGRGKPMTNADLVENLCSASPALYEARRRHLESLRILIPHVFMSDVLARVGICVALQRAEGRGVHRAEAAAILAQLERGLAEGDRETRNVIAVSFVNDSELELFFEELRPLLGPRMGAQLQGR
jgi:hypothetical protein